MQHFKLFSILILLLVCSPSFASVSLPWETTYNCPEWTAYLDDLNCDGLAKGLNGDVGEGIISGSNYSAGGGVRGQRHYYNPGSGGTKLYFDTPPTHIWIRWYMRFNPGWPSDWNSFKVIYLYDTDGSPGYIQLGYPGVGGARMFGGSNVTNSTQTCSNCAFGYAFDVNEWALHEVEIDITGGVARWWINENLIINATGISWNSLGNIRNILIGSNIKGLTASVSVDYDDFKISNTGYIGPVTGGSAPAIRSNASPTSTLTAGTTQVDMTLDTDGNSTCKYDTSSGTAYASMSNTFTTTGGTSHSETITGLTNGSSTTYYIRCDNGVAVNTDDYTITVAVANPSADPTPPTPSSLLLSEYFEDNNWTSRGWYDGTNSVGSTAGGHIGNAMKWDWTTGNTKPTGFSTIRHSISYPVSEVYGVWWEKYETGWQGSGYSSHPHQFYFMSEDDDLYQGPASSNSTMYWESTVDSGTIYGRIAHQDKLRSNSSLGTPPLDLSSTTETRSANHCNTPYTSVGADVGVCYSLSGWYSADIWNAKAVAIPAGEWVKREIYIKMNTFTGGVANYDGIIRTWINGTIDTNETTVLLAAGAYEGKGFSQFVIGPYIGEGSPTNQTLWIDGLELWSVGDTNSICHKDTDGDHIGTGVDEVVSSCSANYYVDAWFDFLTGDCDDTDANIGLCHSANFGAGFPAAFGVGTTVNIR